jgi:hypothetical protein
LLLRQIRRRWRSAGAVWQVAGGWWLVAGGWWQELDYLRKGESTCSSRSSIYERKKNS